jgi:hypothetical protein
VKFGVCLCQEITTGTMPSDHPIRCEWKDLAYDAGWGEPVHQQERYYNSGFVGLHIDRREFLNIWMAANQLAATVGIKRNLFSHGTRTSIFYGIDQDTMNIASMYSKEPLTTIGPEGMGFIGGGFTMYHTAGGKKPWRKKFIRSALTGIPPWNGDKHFLECADGPIQPYSAKQLKKLRRHARYAALIGRFMSRR